MDTGGTVTDCGTSACGATHRVIVDRIRSRLTALQCVFTQSEPVNISSEVRRQEREASTIHAYYKRYVLRVTRRRVNTPLALLPLDLNSPTAQMDLAQDMIDK